MPAILTDLFFITPEQWEEKAISSFSNTSTIISTIFTN